MLPATQESFTTVPNWLIDLMPKMSHAAFNVSIALARLTYGWRTDWTEESARAIGELAGVSRSTAIELLAWLAQAGIVERAPIANNGYRYRLVKRSPEEIACTISLDKRSPKAITSDRPRGSQAIALGDHAYKEERKGKKIKEREDSAPEVEQVRTIGQPDRAPDPLPPVPAAPPPPPAEAPRQPRLVEAAEVDPIAVYRECTANKKPNQAQREAIREAVTGDYDLWQAECKRFAIAGWNVRNVANLIDAYQKAVAQRAMRRRAEDEQRRAEEDRAPISAEQRARNRAILDEARAKLFGGPGQGNKSAAAMFAGARAS